MRKDPLYCMASIDFPKNPFVDDVAKTMLLFTSRASAEKARTQEVYARGDGSIYEPEELLIVPVKLEPADVEDVFAEGREVKSINEYYGVADEED